MFRFHTFNLPIFIHMNLDTIEIEIIHRGETRNYKIVLMPYGYTYRLITHINNQEVIFEPDEEKKLRAISESMIHNQDLSFRELVKLIGEELQKQLQDWTTSGTYN